MGNHDDDDDDDDDSNAVRANDLHDLHCDLISAPFPVQVNNEGKGRVGGGEKGEKKKEREPKSPHTQAPPNLSFLRRTMHKTQRATEPLQDAGLLKRMHSFYHPSFPSLSFPLLCFLCAPLPRPPWQASKQTN